MASAAPPLVVMGRPLRSDAAGRLVAGAPVRAEIRGARIAAVAPAPRDSAGTLGGPDAVLAPALSDPHLHLVAAAAARRTLDLATAAPRDEAELLARIRSWAAAQPEDAWIRAHGYDESRLAEGRHPGPEALDAAAAGRPVRLRHATLHGSLLGGVAAARLASFLGRPADEIDGFVVGCEEALGELTRERDPEGLLDALAAVSEELSRGGVACVDDITASNDAERVAFLAGAVESRRIRQRVRVWLRDADDAAAAREASAGRVEIAGVKLLPRTAEEVRGRGFGEAIARARRTGLPVAIHAVEPDVIDAAVDALAAAPRRARPATSAPDRLEHCSLCPPHLVRRIASVGVAVVTQPGFLFARGFKYRREVEEALWPWLYPIGSLRRAGVLVAAGSDAPVIPTDPRLGFAGATGRRSSEGCTFGADEALSEAEALHLFTGAAAHVRGEADAAEDWLRPGARADLALLSPDAIGSGLAGWRAEATIVAGRAGEGTPA